MKLETVALVVVTLAALAGLLFELWHASSDLALGALASIATLGTQRLAGTDRDDQGAP